MIRSERLQNFKTQRDSKHLLQPTSTSSTIHAEDMKQDAKKHSSRVLEYWDMITDAIV